MPPTVEELRAAFVLERRGLYWRMGAFFVAFAFWAFLAQSFNAMRLFTISQAPSYVPVSVEQYWLAFGGLTGAVVVLGGGIFLQLKRVGDAARRVPDFARYWTPAGRGLRTESRSQDQPARQF